MAPSLGRSSLSSDKSHRRGFSFSSDKSQRPTPSSLKETHEEKEKRLLKTKADPTLAIQEAQPAAVALEKSNLGSLRSMQHRDQWGNIITDPDLSNPTRPRFERPLDTIRSFEAAIDGTYQSRRISYLPSENNSRPGSYYGNSSGRYHDQGYGRSSRPNSYFEYQNNYNGYNHHGGRSRPRPGNRMNPDYGYGNGHYDSRGNVYRNHAYEQSNDNVTTGSGSGSNQTDPWGASTDPSSVNSSLDRLQQSHAPEPSKPEPAAVGDQYSLDRFGAGPQIDTSFPEFRDATPPTPPAHGGRIQSGSPHSYHNHPAHSFDPPKPTFNGPHTNSHGGPIPSFSSNPPSPPPHTSGLPQHSFGGASTSTSASTNGYSAQPQDQGSKSEKRKSWFKRRFSRQ
ncbi:hypothetical protein VTN31DRAFT_4695 [Thermomyces dupontii]|uniref:uncharacterized protein n=1 Tax=Talaromyces thermophilus TaxID=28565 RepID=UPI00374414C3